MPTFNLADYRHSLALDGRVALVTGGAQGIGRAIVLALAAQGAHLVIADRNQTAAETLARQIADAGGQARAVAAELGSQAAAQDIVAVSAETFGRLDVVVHNAAYFPLTPLAAITPEILATTLDVNLGTAFWLCQAATPWFRRQGKGRMLVTSSVTGPRVAYPGLAHYAASKAGVNGFIRAAALELAPSGITVNGVEPGMIRTPAMGNLGDAENDRRLARGIPLGRLGEAEEIAAAMVFLASDAAGYITGQTIVVDGGSTLPEGPLADADPARGR